MKFYIYYIYRIHVLEKNFNIKINKLNKSMILK
jgi:hypothetical protein